MTRPPVEVRRAGLADVEDLLRLWVQAREELAHGPRVFAAVGLGDQLRTRLEAALRSDQLQVAIARWGGQPVGYVLMRLAGLTPLTDTVALHIEQLFVQAEYRRHGVARSLLSAVAGTAERHGADQIVASAPPSSRDTHRYLARLGFSPVVVRRVTPTAVLRRRLAGESRRGALEDLLSRRRSLRARAGWSAHWGEPGQAASCPAGFDAEAEEPDDGAEPEPARTGSPVDTLELPLPARLLSDGTPHPA